MIKNNFFVITGGPGAGKSTLLKSLQDKGFRYIDETGRRIIKQRISEGLSPRPTPAEFARQMFEMDHENYMNNVDKEEILFFDRSFLDSAMLLWQADGIYFEKIKNKIAEHRFNNNVFIAPAWKEIYCNDNERDQTFEEAIKTYELLYDWYEKNNYNIIELPKSSVEKRVDIIMDYIS